MKSYIHIPLKNFTKDEYISKVKSLKGKFTHLIIGEVINCVKWDTMIKWIPGSLYVDGKQYKGAIGKEEFSEIIDTCKECGLEAIPELRFFSHQRKSFLNLQQNPLAKKYAFNDRTENIYETVGLRSELIYEVVRFTECKDVYVGHDESFIIGSPLLKSASLVGKPAPLRDFYESILYLNETFSQMGVGMSLAADAFVIPRSFRDVSGGDKGSVESAGMIEFIPKDITLVTWNYKGITRELVEYFTGRGFTVIGLMFDTTTTYPQLKEAIEGNDKAHPGLATWSRSRAGKDQFINEFTELFPIPEPEPVRKSFWKWLTKFFS